MAPSKLRNAIGAVKDRTSIGLARVSNSASISDLEVAIVKATRHEEYPPEERHIREILSLTCYSPAFVGACVDTISRRLSKTKNWIVALKTLMLIHRLLTDGDPAYVQEIFFATRRGTRLLNMSDFSDKRTNSWDYSALVRTFAMYLDEQLEFVMQKRRGKHGVFSGVDEDYVVDDDQAAVGAAGRATPVRELTTERVFSRVQHLMQLLERFLACRPTGPAKHNTIVIMALYPVVKESFQIYYDITEILTILISRFTELQLQDGVKVYDIFCRVSKQFEDLDSFYGWSKNVGMARSSELPEVDKITQKKLDLMDEYIREKSNDQFVDDKALYLEDQKHEPEEEEEDEKSEAPKEDMNAIKALPAPEEPEKEEKEEVDDNNDKNDTQQEADLLNLGGDSVTVEEHGNKLALALFDGPPLSNGTPENSTTAWEAFKDTQNWETALVQSASHLPNQKLSLPRGFDMMMLDGMYTQGATIQAMASSGYNATGSSSSGYNATGSSSSVAFGSAGRPAMLALPAPPAAAEANSTTARWTNSVDPFEGSLTVPPPSYVQMTEMEKKQRLLMEEQLMWQQYARDGMQGQVGLTKVQQPSYHPYPYNMGGYTRTY